MAQIHPLRWAATALFGVADAPPSAAATAARVCFRSGRGSVGCSPHGTRGPDQRAMGQAGAAAAHGPQVRPAAEVEQTAADRRDPLADPDRGAVAGRAGPLRAWQTVY